ncbi:hypothetical protein P2R40_13830 [Bacillus pseudomycoides]|nr:hypothetical protein [Bacillus pseudomycoides]MDF2084608.1 hypothetical protein [Bacillus pseudomycoides]
MFGGFASSAEAKSASMSGVPSPSHSKRATSAFYGIQLQWLESPVVSPPRTKQKALLCRMLQRPAIPNEQLPLFILH